MFKVMFIALFVPIIACSQNGNNRQKKVASGTAQNTKKVNTTNSIGMEFISTPAGSFLMGAGEEVKDAYNSEKPQHKVSISKPFLIGKQEVTQAQWEAVMGSNPYTLDRSNPYYNLPGMKQRITRPNHPATVSWNDAQAFIKKLNAKEGHNRYRLPTEAEWEYVARAGTTTAYSFGDNVKELGKLPGMEKILLPEVRTR